MLEQGLQRLGWVQERVTVAPVRVLVQRLVRSALEQESELP